MIMALLTIGDFSRMTHLSVKALRHYHDMGVLEPAVIDPFTGYRSYDTSQVPAAQVIPLGIAGSVHRRWIRSGPCWAPPTSTCATRRSWRTYPGWNGNCSRHRRRWPACELCSRARPPGQTRRGAGVSRR